MNKIILILCAVIALAKADFENVNPISFPSTMVARNDEYIKMNTLQYLNILQDIDTKLEQFKNQYSGRVKLINVQTDMITASIVQIEERLNPLELLSDLSKKCVVEHRVLIPSVIQTKRNITSCILEAKIQADNLLKNPTDTRNSLQRYYTNYLKDISNCANKYGKKTPSYTKCVTYATSETNTYFTDIEKIFETDMDVAECSAKAYVKKALECSYSIQRKTISLIAEADLLINNCIEGKDNCKPCDFACPVSVSLPVDYNSKTMPNPFYKKKNHPGCLLVQVHN